ncbi:MAG: extracellular solute-binding protein [Candidatus Gracilibacteria bacterium]|jgi:ABC-type glycerol-3-phosphate transport system substrate-binding protein
MKSKINLKKILAGLLVATLVFGISGCRTKDPQQSQVYTGVKLTYYKPFDDSEVMDPLINEYQATHPGVQITYKKFADFDEYQKTVLSEMAEGEGPDIFSMPNWWYASNLGKIAPLPEDQGGTKDVFSGLFVDVATSDLVRVDKDGLEKVYALPMTVDTLALYYNKDHYEDRIPDRGKPAKTWEGIKEDVALLNKINSSTGDFDVSGIAMGRWDNISRAVDTLYLLFLQYGVGFYNDAISEATFAARHEGLLTYPGLEALNLFVSFADPSQKHYSWAANSADLNIPDAEIDAFARGNVSMIIGYAYAYNDIVNRISVLKAKGERAMNKDSIRIAPIPQVYDPDTSQEKRVTYASYFAETVSRNSKNAEVAWDFLIYLTSNDVLKKYFDTIHKPTSRRDMIDPQSKDPIYGVFSKQIGYAESFPIVDYYRYKEIFTETLRKSYEQGGGTKSNLVDAQDLIDTMLPKDGYVNKKKALIDEVPADGSETDPASSDTEN